METWAYCEACQRWFYVPASEEIRLEHSCPACERVAEHVVSAANPAAAAAIPRPTG